MYILVPDVQSSSASVMVDGLVAAVELVAVLQLARYIEGQQPRHVYAFGCLAAMGVLTKVNALAMVIVPFLALGLTRRWRLMRRKELWLSLLIGFVLALVTYYGFARMLDLRIGGGLIEDLF